MISKAEAVRDPASCPPGRCQGRDTRGGCRSRPSAPGQGAVELRADSGGELTPRPVAWPAARPWQGCAEARPSPELAERMLGLHQLAAAGSGPRRVAAASCCSGAQRPRATSVGQGRKSCGIAAPVAGSAGFGGRCRHGQKAGAGAGRPQHRAQRLYPLLLLGGGRALLAAILFPVFASYNAARHADGSPAGKFLRPHRLSP